ncbi:hypothetical protein JZP79_13570 (plasmid) [Enterococcus faecalis]|uniref:hypothetical protein n=1 Tax=Enterococcus faecalis TaxID=1351 RepID=UPI0019D39BA0|nr:hypothetical protein [Enterococcus faecalis]QSO30529.1 hypothetical protein JZP79_13570 [Enterococcus faecalis]
MIVIVLLLVIILLLMRMAPKRSRSRGDSLTFGQNAMITIVCFVVVLIFGLFLFF